MYRKENNRNKFHQLILGLILSAVLAACTPVAGTQDIQPTFTQISIATEPKLASATPELSATPEMSATPENTPTPKNSPTPDFTATPKAMTQAEIRAEILAAGVNLDDLANSEDEWVSSYISLEGLQNDIDNLNFDSENEGFIRTVVIGLEAVENLEELEQAIETDGGWKLTTFAKLAYKDANGDWQIIKVPLNAYNPEKDLLWVKDVSTRSGSHFIEGERFIQIDNNGYFILPFINTWTSRSNSNDYHWGTGSFIQLFTGWIENPDYANNDAVLGDFRDTPHYTEEQLIEFRKTGDPSIFGYQDSDGYWIFWPIVTFNANLSTLSNYDHE